MDKWLVPCSLCEMDVSNDKIRVLDTMGLDDEDDRLWSKQQTYCPHCYDIMMEIPPLSFFLYSDNEPR